MNDVFENWQTGIVEIMKENTGTRAEELIEWCTKESNRIDRLEAFTQAMLGIFPELDAEYQHIYRNAPNRIVGRTVVRDTSELHSTIKTLQAENKQLRKHDKHREKIWKKRLMKDGKLKIDDSDNNEFAIIYKANPISVNDIILYLDRLSELEKQNDKISRMVLAWTESLATVSAENYICLPDVMNHIRGYLDGVSGCLKDISEVWHE